MPGFRRFTSGSALPAKRLSLEMLRQVVLDVTHPAHFFVAPGHGIEWEYRATETLPWEIYHGQLVDPKLTRLRQTFESWNAYLLDQTGRTPVPLLALKLDWQEGRLYLTRAIHSYTWEGYDAGNNVYLSREIRKWVVELVATIEFRQIEDAEGLRDELICGLFRAVVGASRLPLTSLEAPLPAYSFGQLAYFYRSHLNEDPRRAGALHSCDDLLQEALQDDLTAVEKAKLLETLLHATTLENTTGLTSRFVARWQQLGYVNSEITALLRTLFNEISLTPYTGIVEKALALLDCLEKDAHLTPWEGVDFLGHLLRQVCRHLTAYDLVTFHHNGANYPDALLLDAVLKAYLGRAEHHPELFISWAEDGTDEEPRKRLRRRALRQGWLLRSRYEGHLVPDYPTSQGENTRILPPSHPRVPEEQIVNPIRRTRRLFANDPLMGHAGPQCRSILRLSMQDLHHPRELRELGMALFLDRSLGAFKRRTEPDRTLLLSYEAFSRSLAERRLQYLARDLHWLDEADHTVLRSRLQDSRLVAGVAHESLPGPGRPAPVSLDDARKVASDFVFLRTTSRTANEFFEHFDFGPVYARWRLRQVAPEQPVLIVSDGPMPGLLGLYDAQGRKRLELSIDHEGGYASRGGLESPVHGLRLLRVWEEAEDSAALREVDLHAECFRILPRDG